MRTTRPWLTAPARKRGPWGLVGSGAAPPGVQSECEPRFTAIVAGDTDCDGAPDIAELGSNPLTCGTRDPNNRWDFYDVPVPTLCSGEGTMDDRDGAVSVMADVLAVLEYTNTQSGDPDRRPDEVRCDYNDDRDGDGIADGIAYDRSVGATWSDGPDGAVTILVDVLLVLAQSGHSCRQ